ncbi:hypothetical protein HanRHA438_Chr10g0455281 [Helianthus annuus]|nr:hypothetical protein HanIR_Chr10g0477631 [Helianthus annuus]KAJ0879763.1 hypothetical protein HanRHA438_Chr10g0455281 [Helianthus annuus]
MASDKEAAGELTAVDGGFVAARLMYWTPTCWRLYSGFLGLTARRMTRMTATATSTRKENKRKRQQQQPLMEAEEDDVEECG